METRTGRWGRGREEGQEKEEEERRQNGRRPDDTEIRLCLSWISFGAVALVQ